MLKKFAFRVVIFGFGASAALFAENENRIFAIDAVVGVPQLLGVELTYVGLPEFELGIGFGSAPINNTLNAKVGLSPIALNLGTGNTYNLYPSSSFTLTSFTPYVRYFPGKKNFYLQFAYSMARAGANVSGDLKDETSGFISHGVVNGSLNYVQNIFTLSAGYRPYLTPNFFINIQGGLSWLSSSSYSLNVGGSLSNILDLVPAGQAAFDQAIATIKSQVDSAVSQYRDKVTFIPSLAFAVGFAF